MDWRVHREAIDRLKFKYYVELKTICINTTQLTNELFSGLAWPAVHWFKTHGWHPVIKAEPGVERYVDKLSSIKLGADKLVVMIPCYQSLSVCQPLLRKSAVEWDIMSAHVLYLKIKPTTRITYQLSWLVDRVVDCDLSEGGTVACLS